MRLTALFLSAFAVGGCHIPPGDCPEPKPGDGFISGEYASRSAHGGVTFGPHLHVEGLTMSLDADAGMVEIRFTRRGKAVVERWRMMARDVEAE